MFLGDLPRDEIHLGLRLFQRDARFEPRDGPEMTAGALLVVRRLGHRPIEFSRAIEQAGRQRMEIGRHHANHGVGAAAQLDSSADNIRIAGKSPLPQTVAQNDDEIFAILLFFRREDAAEQRLAAHDGEKPVADLRAGNSLRFAVARQDRAKFSIGRDLLEDVVPRALIGDIGRGNLSARSAAGFVFAPDENNRLRLLIGQRFQAAPN